MHCEKCGSADTEVIKCGDCGQKSRVRCANCGYYACTDKYCSVIAIKRKIRLLTWCAGIIFLVMLGTLPFVISTYMGAGGDDPGGGPVPTVMPTEVASPTPTPTPTPAPTPTRPATPPTPTAQPTRPATPTPPPPTARPGDFPNQAAFRRAIVEAIDAGEGIMFGTGTNRAGMRPDYYVRWTFRQIDWDVPESIDGFVETGRRIDDMSALQPGDVLFFSIRQDGRASYVGIYRGDGRFACIAPTQGRGWVVGPLAHDFFRPRFLFARRFWPRPSGF